MKLSALQQFLNERLRLSVISPAAARYAGIQAMTAANARAKGYALPEYAVDGFLIPYSNQRGKLIPGIWRWRNNPSAVEGFAALTKDRRYIQPAATDCWVYFPHVEGLVWARTLARPEIPVAVVEGELKALSLCCAGVPAVGIGGVWNWLLHKELFT